MHRKLKSSFFGNHFYPKNGTPKMPPVDQKSLVQENRINRLTISGTESRFQTKNGIPKFTPIVPKIPGSVEPNQPVEPISAVIGRPIDFDRSKTGSGLNLTAKRNTDIDRLYQFLQKSTYHSKRAYRS